MNRKAIKMIFILVLILTLTLTLQASVWYVNDASTIGDVYTTTTGNDANSGTSDAPFLTISKALSVASAYDTIYIDAGTYSETVVIDTDGIALIGADSQSTIIDVGDSAWNGASSYKVIYAENVSNIVIENLKVRNAYYGIYFNNVDNSIIQNITAENNGGYGLYLTKGSDYNSLSNNTAGLNNLGGFYLYSSSNNTVSSNNGDGFYLYSSSSNTLSNNTSSNAVWGFYLSSSSNNILSDNTSANSTYGFYLRDSNNNTLNNNISLNNFYAGFYFENSWDNTITKNDANNDYYAGFAVKAAHYDSFVNNFNNDNYINGKIVKYLQDVSNITIDGEDMGALIIAGGESIIIRNLNIEHGGIYLGGLSNSVIESNVISYGGGIWFTSSETNTIRYNSVNLNGQAGFRLHYSNNNTLNFNRSLDNGDGFEIWNSSNNILNGNIVYSNNWYGFEFIFFCNNNTLSNNIVSSNGWAGFYLGSSSNNTLSNNTIWNNGTWSQKYDGVHMSNSDSNVLKNNIIGSNGKYGIYIYNGADNTIKYNDVWNNASGNYYGCSAGEGDISVDPLFVSTDPSSPDYLHLSSNSPCIDAGDPSDPVPPGGGSRIDIGAYEYIQSAPEAPNTGHIWYVNDTSTVGDVYTTAIGNDNNSGDSTAPFRTIMKALSVASAYDTIYIDAGTYSETVVIDTDGIALIGADSQSTIIDVGDPSSSSAYKAISAETVTNIVIKNLKVRKAYYGIYFNNVDISIIQNVTAENNVNGIYLKNGSDTNTLNGNTAISNNYCGFWLNNSTANTLSENVANSNNTSFSIVSSSKNTLIGNISSNNRYGFYLRISVANTLSGNMSSNNREYGFWLSNSSNNTLSGNVANSNNWAGFYLHLSSSNTLSGNTASSNNKAGFYLCFSWNNNISGNDANNDTYAGFVVWAASYDSFVNNISNDNYINGKIVKYLHNVSNITIDDDDIGALIIAGGESITIKNLNLEHGGIYLGGVHNSLIENNVVKYGGGIWLCASDTNIIRNNTSSNNWAGFYLYSSSNNTLSGNVASSNNHYGFRFSLSNNSMISNNTIWDNGNGNYKYDGVILISSDSNVLKNNIIGAGKYGIYIYNGPNNIIKYNNVWNNASGNYSGCSAGEGDISADPLFVSIDPNSSDYLHLSSSSPCIDAGDPSDPVPPGGGSRIDIGAYEYGAEEVTKILTADAGSDTTVMINQKVILNGSGYSSENSALQYVWRQVSGPAVTLLNINSPNPEFAPDTEGEFVFGLRVTDGEDTSAEDTVVITALSIRADIVNMRRPLLGLGIDVLTTPKVKQVIIKYSNTIDGVFNTLMTLSTSDLNKRLWQTVVPWNEIGTGVFYFKAIPMDEYGNEYSQRTTILSANIYTDSKGETGVMITNNGLGADIIDVSLSEDLENRIPRGKMKLLNTYAYKIKKIYVVYYHKKTISVPPYYEIDAHVRLINLNSALTQKILDCDLRPIMEANRVIFLVIVYEKDGKDCVFSKRLIFSRPTKKPSIQDPILGTKVNFKNEFKREVMVFAKAKKKEEMETEKKNKVKIVSDPVEFELVGDDPEFYPGQEAEIEIPFDTESVDTPTKLKVVYWDEKEEKWSRKGVTTVEVDTANLKVKAVTKHFTEFAVIENTTKPQVEIKKPLEGRYTLANPVIVFDAYSAYSAINTVNFRVKIDDVEIELKPSTADGLDNDNDGDIDETNSDSELYFYYLSDTGVRFTVKVNNKLSVGEHTIEVTVWDVDGVVTDNPAKIGFKVSDNLEDINIAHNYPNPFDPKTEKTHFELGLSQRAYVKIRIYDFAGQLVDELGGQEYEPGDEIDWDGRDKDTDRILANGVYFAVIEARNGDETRKKVVKTMILSK